MASLDLLASDPAHVADLSLEQAAACLRQVTALHLALVGRLIVMGTASPTTARAEVSPDRLLTPREAAARLGVTVRWLYRHADQLAFTKRLSPRTLRFSEAGMAREMAAKKTLNKGRGYA